MSEVKVNKISPRTNCGTTQLGDAGDTITVTGDLKSNSLKSASGSTITLGQSGDTIQLGCGASQTGFGRTGTVNWDTTAKTASFTAVSGNGYFVNTTSGAITLTLPASPSAGDIVAFKDYAFTFATNNLTVDGNGSPIGGVDGTINPTYDTNGTSKTFIYVDGTKGWLVTNESTDTSQESNPTFICATGGTITTSGDYKIHTFTGPGTFCVSSIGNPAGGPNNVSYMVVAGGGSGGRTSPSGGGGGAGGYREGKDTPDSYTASPLATTGLPVSATGYPIAVGGGGATTTCYSNKGNDGSNASFSTITSTGGGGGGVGAPAPQQGGDGGSGGGSGWPGPSNVNAGSGNTPPVSPPQGNNGGGGSNSSPGTGGGGGGGALSGGGFGVYTGTGGAGGNGQTSCITASPVARAGGGGGGAATTAGSGGAGGGGNGSSTNSPGGAATANTGGGGGGNGPLNGLGGAGGSGIVIIRYKYQ